MPKYLYLELADKLSTSILSGQIAVGQRLPSVRKLCQEMEVSKSTVLAALSRLEAKGLISARTRSGYFVNVHLDEKIDAIQHPLTSQPESTPVMVTADQVLVDIMDKGAAFDLIREPDSGSGNEQLRRCLTRALRRQSSSEQSHYDEPAGLVSLRRQLQLPLSRGGGRIKAEDLVITAGCQNALLLALMATTERGDVVAVESPGFYGVLQLLEVLGLKALELPSASDHGLSPDALELALQHWPIKTLVLSPCYGTPMGSCMPDTHKQRIVDLIESYGITAIEDDIYGDLCFGQQRPRTLYSFNTKGSVLLCSSFSKTLSRDLCIGWIAPGRFREKVKQLKLVTTLANSRTAQQGLCYFLQEGGYDRHLRLFRQQLQQQYAELLALISRFMPSATSCSRPEGGLSLWLEFPDTVDTLELYNETLDQNIVLTPGRLFTVQKRYQNALRLSFAYPWTDKRIEAFSQLGAIIENKIQ